MKERSRISPEDKRIPVDEIEKLLYQQVELLIEKSKDCEPSEIRENIKLLIKLRCYAFPVCEDFSFKTLED